MVAEEQRGIASGLLNTASLLATIGCLGIALAMLSVLGSSESGVAISCELIAVLLAFTLGLSVIVLREGSLGRASERTPAAPGYC